MEISHTNTLEDFFFAAAIVFTSFVVAQYLYRFLRRMIEKNRFGQSTSGQTKSLLQIPGFFRLFIMIRGSLLAFDLFRVDPLALELAAASRTALALIGNLFLYFGLITATRAVFTAWVTNLAKDPDSGHNNHSKTDSVEVGIRKTRILNNLLLLPLGVLIFLPELDLNIPKEEILYGAALLFLINALFISFVASALQKNPVVPLAKKISQSPYELALLESMTGKDPNFPLIIDIVSLFLDIVKHHLGASIDTSCRYTMVEHNASEAKYLFELEILLHNTWKKRRITVGRLAADSGSRSKCFYVIYNEYLVVKIPPEPITDPAEYLDSLKHEAAISRQIDMKECIIPSISVMLKYVDSSIEGDLNSIDSPEELAMISLRRHPEHFRFLKVGESFAYFMDMSKYYFLQDVIKTLHETTSSGNRAPFLRIKPSLEGIVANLLNLLVRVGDKGVALRDLKPDNMLVAGDRNNYPGFLNRPAEYVIGLIDIETAVVYGNPPRKIIGQPQSGGTPRYATPSHFFKNNLIQHLYDDLATILHFQDWYGMIAVIFKVITTRSLFKEAAKTIPPIVQKLNSITEADEFVRFAMDASCFFWRTAGDEFHQNMSEEQERMDELIIQLDEQTASMFIARITADQNDLNEAIRKMVTTQALYTGDAQKLLQASAEEIENFSGQWQKLCETRTDLQKRLPQAVRLLTNLREMKLEAENSARALKLLSTPAPKITARLLLETMFSLVSRKMYRQEWKKLPAKNLGELMRVPGNNLSETLLEETCAEYQTVFDGPTEKI